MIKHTMTEYTFEIKRKIKVSVFGRDSEENLEKAEAEAIRQLKKDLEDDIEVYNVEEYEDFEKEYGEAV